MKFSSILEKKIQNKFLKNGYYIFNIRNKSNLNIIKKRIIKFSRKWLKQKSISVKSVNYFECPITSKQNISSE